MLETPLLWQPAPDAKNLAVNAFSWWLRKVALRAGLMAAAAVSGEKGENWSDDPCCCC